MRSCPITVQTHTKVTSIITVIRSTSDRGNARAWNGHQATFAFHDRELTVQANCADRANAVRWLIGKVPVSVSPVDVWRA